MVQCEGEGDCGAIVGVANVVLESLFLLDLRFFFLRGGFCDFDGYVGPECYY